MDNKLDLYKDLVQLRKQCRDCDSSLKNPSKIEYGIYDSDEIGPWSLWQNSLQANILLIGQDWGTTKEFIKQRGVDCDSDLTNKHLKILFNSIGISVDLPSANMKNSRLFFTNQILCLRENSKDEIGKDCCYRCVNKFLKPLIDIISPRIIITLGELAYISLKKTYKLPSNAPSLKRAVNNNLAIPIGNMVLCPVYHCGNYGTLYRDPNNRNDIPQQKSDWQKIKLYI